jgi:hypothetical protein
MYRYIMSYEPYYFKGRLSDFPLTMAYGQKMDALRAELRDYFWDGEFRDKLGATVTFAAQPHHPYAVFRRADGMLGVVVANDDDDQTITVTVRADNNQPLAQYRLVDDPLWRSTEGGVTVPPRSAAVVIA